RRRVLVERAGARSRPFMHACRDPPRAGTGRHLHSRPADPHLAVLDHADILSRGDLVFRLIGAAARAAVGATHNGDATIGSGLVPDFPAHLPSLLSPPPRGALT